MYIEIYFACNVASELVSKLRTFEGGEIAPYSSQNNK